MRLSVLTYLCHCFTKIIIFEVSIVIVILLLLGMHGQPLLNSEDRGIPLTERLLPSYLKELGYSTHLVGKWHVGMSRREYLPTQRGYDTHYGMRGGFIDYYTYNKVESVSILQ